MVALFVQDVLAGREPVPPPRTTAFGSLLHYVAHSDPENFQPGNITFALLPPLEGEEKRRSKSERHRRQIERALEDFERWMAPRRVRADTAPVLVSSERK
jgi:methylenetetrahydrofolate--tRNA-(uracil-5-)-methyltransferase